MKSPAALGVLIAVTVVHGLVIAPDIAVAADNCESTTADYAYNCPRDLAALDATNSLPGGLWSDGTTMWVVDTSADKIFAYKMSDGSHDSGKDFATLAAAGNDDPGGLWSDGTTMWVADSGDDKLFAYKMSDKSRDSDKDIDLAAANEYPGGLWSDGTTMWVADLIGGKIYAYRMSDGSHDSGKDFATLAAAGNSLPNFIWSDGITMWATDLVDDKIYAYRMSSKRHNPAKEFDTLVDAGNQSPSGIWSDGATIWVADTDDDRLYAYNLPGEALLSSLTLSDGALIPAFRPVANSYSADVGSSTSSVTVAAATAHPAVTFTISPQDSDTGTGGHQINLSETSITTITITVTASDGLNTRDYTVAACRAATCPFGRKAGEDFNTLKAAGNDFPTGIWSDGTTMWVSEYDNQDNKLYAYKMSGKGRDSGKDIDLAGPNEYPGGLWSNGTTMWVADPGDTNGDKIFAYKMSDKTRDSGKDFSTLHDAGNGSPRGIWSDGTTMWVADITDDKIYAYKMSDKSRDSGKDFNTLKAAGNDRPVGIWSDGTTMWVADFGDDKIFAYRMSDKVRDPAKDFNILKAAGNTCPYGLWSDGTTMQVTDFCDDKIYAYQMPSDATLSALGVSGATLSSDFDPKIDFYRISPGSEVTTVTVSATANDSDASLDISQEDSDTETEGYQISLGTGITTITVTVTASDGLTTKDYTIEACRANAACPAKRKTGSEFDATITSSSGGPWGLWSDGTTMWVAADSASRLYAHDLSTGARDSGKDFTTSLDTANAHPYGLWSDGTTMWVADTNANKIFAYKMSDKSRDSGKDFDTLHDAGNDDPAGIWSDGTTMWVVERGDNHKIFAYKMSDKSRDSGKDFNTLKAAGNGRPLGIWSDGTTMWVSDFDDNKIYAYKMSDKTRDPVKDLDTLDSAGNGSPSGIWSDGATMWVADFADDKIYAYQMPGGDATLSTLEVSDATLSPDFDPAVEFYQANSGDEVTTVTVSTTANDSNASLTASPVDSDTGTEGYQVDLDVGITTVTVTVTAANEIATTRYTVDICRGSANPFAYNCTNDFHTLPAADNNAAAGIWSDGTTMWVADQEDDKLYAYDLTTKARDSAKDLTLGSSNTDPVDIWSDGTTMWVADWEDKQLYAYTLSTGDRDLTNDFTGLDDANIDDNELPTGIWSDGTTMWVIDRDDNKAYAYAMSTKTRDSAKDFALDDANTDARSIWSDGTTIWISDGSDKLFAYVASTKARATAKDFGALAGAGNSNPLGLWSDGTTMWVADWDDSRLYAYNMPGSEPVIAINADKSTVVHRAWDRASFTLTRDGDTNQALSVDIEVTETDDYVSEGTKTVTFAAGESTKQLILPLSQAGSSDGSITATVQDGSDYDVGSPGLAMVVVKILNPAMEISLTQEALTVVEGGTTAVELVAKAAAGSPQPGGLDPITVSLTTRADTASANNDFEPITKTITFEEPDFSLEAGRWTARKTITVTAKTDSLTEGDEIFGLLLQASAPLGGAIVITDGSPQDLAWESANTDGARVTITDVPPEEEPPEEVTDEPEDEEMEDEPESVLEGPKVLITINEQEPAQGPFRVTFTFPEAVEDFDTNLVYASYVGGPRFMLTDWEIEEDGVRYTAATGDVIDGKLWIVVQAGAATSVASGMKSQLGSLSVDVDVPNRGSSSSSVIIWQADLTVGDSAASLREEHSRSNISGSLGYSTADYHAGFGALSDNDFQFSGQTYTVHGISYTPSWAVVIFAVCSDMAFVDEGFELHLGDSDSTWVSFAPGEVAHLSFMVGGQACVGYEWHPIGLDWEENEVVQVKFVH